MRGPGFVRRSAGLFATIVVAALTVVLALSLDAAEPFRVATSLALALYLPGYAFLAAAYPNDSIEGPAKVTLSIGLSISITSLLGLVLNWPGSGLDLTNWCIGLTGLTVIFATTGLIRREGVSAPTMSFRAPLWFGLALVPACALAIVAVGVSAQGAADQPEPGFSVLTVNAEASKATVVNREKRPERYRLTTSIGSEELGGRSRRLNAGDSWVVKLPESSGQGELEIDLYKDGQPGPYRTLRLSASDPSSSESGQG
jgi:uncharacterized membrane protein